MDKDKLSPREQALLAEARREAATRGEPAAAVPQPDPAPQPARAPSAAERLARLMEDERAESQERKRKMRRNGLLISAGILAVFALWLLSTFLSRRR